MTIKDITNKSKKKKTTKDSSSIPSEINHKDSDQGKELQETLLGLKEFIKMQQDQLLLALSEKAGVPMAPVPVPALVKPITKEDLVLQLGYVVLEAWTTLNSRDNSRQLSVFNRLNKPDMQKLMKEIQSFKAEEVK
jgi:hypothetical protein